MLIEEGDEALAEIAREARKFLWRVLLLALFFVGLMVVSVASAQEAPIYQAVDGDVTLSLYTSPCRLDGVSNLKLRAVWTETGKAFEGCFGIKGGIAVFYFEDKSVFILPMSIFKKVTFI